MRKVGDTSITSDPAAQHHDTTMPREGPKGAGGLGGACNGGIGKRRYSMPDDPLRSSPVNMFTPAGFDCDAAFTGGNYRLYMQLESAPSLDEAPYAAT
jgi:hypothetical protein